MRRPSPERIGFVLSLAILAFLYGFGSSAFGWFPGPVVRQGIQQGLRIVASPAFTVPRVYDRQGARTVEPDRVQPGLTLVAKNWRSFDWKQGIKLIDAEGRIVHTWRVEVEEAFPDSVLAGADRFRRPVAEYPIHGTHLFRNGDVLINVEYLGSVRLNACGDVLWSLAAGNHHSIHRSDDGSFWIPAVHPDLLTTSPGHPEGFPGLGQPVYQDRILRVSEDGRVLDAFNLLDLLYENGLARHIVRAKRLTSEDVTHLNDVEPLPESLADQYPLFEAGDLLVSLRNLHLVFVFDPDTETLRWHASHPFLYQHDPDFIGDGWIGVFDNNLDGTDRGTMLGGSRIIALQPHTDSTKVLFPGPEAGPFYTEYMGKWQLLENGNLLLTESRAGRLVEVAPDGTTVWEWYGEPYGDDRMTEISEGVRYPLTSEDVASWPCAAVDATAFEGGGAE